MALQLRSQLDEDAGAAGLSIGRRRGSGACAENTLHNGLDRVLGVGEVGDSLGLFKHFIAMDIDWMLEAS